MAKTVRVLPRDDGQNFQGSWMVHVSGKMKSNHTNKQAAKNAARGYANDGDTLVIHRQNGTIQKKVTYRGSSSSKDEGSTFFAPGTGTFSTAISDAFD